MARPLKEALLPTSRRGSNLIYDTKNKRFILFGGFDGTTRYNEVWELSAGSAYSRWHKLTPSGTAPAARNLGAAVFVRGTTSGSVDKAYMVIWGGAIPGDTNTMAALDLSVPGSETWTAVTQTNTPAARSYLTHHMAAKSVGASASDLYLFGGWGSSRTNDLVKCTFDVNTPTAVTWTTLKANGAAGNPPGRSGTAMIYDSANNRLVITCGYTGSVYLNDTWSYSISGNTFTQLSPGGTAPAIRELPSIGYDTTNQRAVLLGGWQGAATNTRNDIFQLTLTPGSEAWTQLKANDTSNQAILAFSSAAAAVDTDRNLLVVAMLLGYDSTSKYVYCFDMKDTSLTTPLYGLTTVDDFRARDAPGSVYDPTRGEWLLINGYSAMDDDTTISRGEHVSEVWAYDPVKNQWRYAAKGPLSMPQSEGGLAVYDAANDRIIYFGGLTGTNQRLNDVWQLKADEYGMYVATRLRPAGTPPTQRWLMAGCYDAANQRMVLWGGQSAAGVLGDVWSLSLASGSETWTQLTPGGTAPTAAWQPAFAYDDANKRLYIHGGATDANGTTYTSQLYYLDVSTTNGVWTNTGVTGGLGVRGAVMIYDATNQRLICFGGFNGTAVNSTLRYTSTAAFTAWTTQAAPNTPPARRSAGCVFIGGNFLVACGRPVTGTWFRDTQQLNANTAPGSWAWAALAPTAHQIVAVPVTGLVDRASYHWQAWTVAGSTTGSPSSFGGNSESAADFIPGTPGGRVKVAVGWTAKPVKVWTGSAWVTKPVKVWNGTAWIETSY
ncbi:kelch repeat-containing protein [Streptomyces caniscabiei]|uniref:Kelch repeat-containing protein n=1 Tax=Streptomyces caniscabiei TaxID=2746961 RepID=UPI0029AE5066|nr:kelch repeat-containing protein [Streptomyces caniscabiei]MDX2775977.1 kelch repeat-containing protein [Streptomyces caniscabiei]